MRRHRQLASLLCAAAMIFAAISTSAQNSDSGGVMGRVYCADTQKPARFANVRLQPAEGQDGSFGGRGGFATTGSDGSFRITGVSPGEYYIDVMMPGYIQPMRGMLSSFENLAPEERDRITAQLTRVNVALNQSANVQVMIYRGATIGGTVNFDDGSPAAGVSIQALLLPAGIGAKTVGSGSQQSFAGFARTDDRGQFRVTGLGDGTYIIFAAPRSIFPIYYGNTIERSHAKKFEVHAGDEVPGRGHPDSGGGNALRQRGGCFAAGWPYALAGVRAVASELGRHRHDQRDHSVRRHVQVQRGPRRQIHHPAIECLRFDHAHGLRQLRPGPRGRWKRCFRSDSECSAAKLISARW